LLRLGAVTERKGQQGFREHFGYDACGRLASQVAVRADITGQIGGVARSYQVGQGEDKAR